MATPSLLRLVAKVERVVLLANWLLIGGNAVQGLSHSTNIKYFKLLIRNVTKQSQMWKNLYVSSQSGPWLVIH